MQVPMDRFESWLLNKNLKPRTIQNYIYYFNKFSFDVFNQDTVSRFLAESSNRNVIARSFLLNYQKFLLVNSNELGISQELKGIIASVELPKLTGRRKVRVIKPVPWSQIELIENSFDEEEYKLRLLLTCYGGLRLGELFKIRIISFNWDKWKANPEEMGECIVLGKGDKEGMAFFPAKIMRRVAKFVRSRKFDSLDSFIFVKSGQQYNFNNLARDWQKKLSEASIKAGVVKIDSEGKIIRETAVHPHRLRHSYATHLVEDLGVDIQRVRILMRHSDISSTLIYTHTERDKIKEEISVKLV